MEPSFWHQKWARQEIAFHGSEANPLLLAHFDALALPPPGRVFLPLCGKTLDIHWLLARGYRVAGAELSQSAVEQLFSELGEQPTVAKAGELTRLSAPNIDIFVGDIFALSAELLGPVDAVYDRAALVALPAEMRVRYAAHLRALTAGVPQLLISFEYDQAAMDGPPFSVPGAEIRQHHAAAFPQLAMLDSVDVPGGLKGQCAAQEQVWLLR